jgi:hypothetical protein
MLPLRRRRSTAVWLLTGQVARMPPLVGEGYGNRRDRPLVEFDGAKVAHAIRLRDGDVSAASALAGHSLSKFIAPPERFMTITISNLTVPPSASTGTIIGVLTATDAGSIISCNFILSKKSSGYFAISSNNLITVWSGSIAPGYYPVRVRAVGINERFSGSAAFIINVIEPPSLPTRLSRQRHRCPTIRPQGLQSRLSPYPCPMAHRSRALWEPARPALLRFRAACGWCSRARSLRRMTVRNSGGLSRRKTG